MTEHNQQVTIVDGAYVNFASQLGTDRDKAAHGTFVKNTTLGDDDFEAVYQDWLPKKIINRPVQDMLRAGWYFAGIEESQSKAMQDEIIRLKLVDRLYRLIKWMRLYGAAYLLIGVNDGKPLDQPLDIDNLQQGRLQFFTVIKKSQVEDVKSSYLPLETTYGEPHQPTHRKVKQDRASYVVHSSRLIKLANGDEEESVLLAIYNTLLQFASTNASAASLVHESKIDIIRTPDLAMMLKSRMKEVLERFSAAAFMKSLNGMLVMDKEEEYDSKSYSFGGLPELMREFSQQTAGAADIPYTVLFGRTTSGLNNSGEFDLRSYYDRINTDQNWILRPLLNVLMLMLYRNLYGSTPQGMSILFNSLWQMDAKTRAEVEKANAERDVKYFELGIVNESQIARQLREDKVYDFLTDDHIKTLELVNEDPPD